MDSRFNTPVGLRPTCGRDARAPRDPPFGAFPGTAGIPRLPHAGAGLPASTHRWAFGPLAGGTPALPGTPPFGAFPGTAGILPASTHRWAFGPLAGGTPALPGSSARRLSWDRGQLARFNPPVGLRPTCGRVARAPRFLRSAPFLGPRASCPLQPTGGPAAHLRAGRPRSQEPLRSAPFPGPRASCPLQPTGGPAAHLRAGRPRSQGPSARRLSWDRGHLARLNPRVGLRPTCGRDARAPRNTSARCLSWDRGHLARFNTRVGLRPTCGWDARAPRNTSARCLPWERDHYSATPGNTAPGRRPSSAREASVNDITTPRSPSLTGERPAPCATVGAGPLTVEDFRGNGRCGRSVPRRAGSVGFDRTRLRLGGLALATRAEAFAGGTIDRAFRPDHAAVVPARTRRAHVARVEIPLHGLE